MVTAGRGKPTYVERLDEAWRAHLAPREPGAPTVVSLFAGCGGSSMGYSMAGYREALAVEWDANAIATLRLNFPDVPVYHGDIVSLSVEQALEMSGLTVGELDVLDGSPPCQGFSTGGRRRIDDPRNDLSLEFVRFLSGLRPKAFVMENVSGMVKGKMRLVFVDILRALKTAGYRVSVRVLNAMYFGAPQSRVRLIFVGVRGDLAATPSHPPPLAAPATVATALVGCPWEQPPPRTATRSNAWADTLRPGTHYGARFSLIKADARRPSPTISKSVTVNGTAQLLHPTEKRVLTIPELKRLQAFPDDFRFVGSFTERWACIGNSVPPLFMRAIATHVRRHILEAA